MTDNGDLTAPDQASLPRGWAARTLADAVVPGRPRGKPLDFVGQPFVGLEHIEAHTTRMLGSAPAETMKSSGVVFEEGDVLYARMRPYLNKVWLADRDGLCSGEFIVFPKTGALRGAFLKYRLNAQDFVSFTDHATTGDRPRADFAEFGRFPVLVPPLAEQARIADRIDELFTDLAAGVAALERVKRNLSRYRAAVLHAAVTGRLTGGAEWGASENWKPIGDIVGPIEQGWSPKCERVPAKTDDEWAVMTTTAIQKMHFDSGENKLLPAELEPVEQYEIREGDLLVTRAGPRKRCGIACLVRETRPRLILCDKAYRFRAKEGAALPEFIELILNAWPITMAIERAKTGSSDSGLNLTQKRFKAINVPLPEVATQSAIVEVTSEKLSQIDALEAEVARGLARAGRLRQAILKAAFEGKLVPQDPSDEPASVLLERIREQAADAPKPKRKTRKKTTRNAATR